jgi:hypothetical protein
MRHPPEHRKDRYVDAFDERITSIDVFPPRVSDDDSPKLSLLGRLWERWTNRHIYRAVRKLEKHYAKLDRKS